MKNHEGFPFLVGTNTIVPMLRYIVKIVPSLGRVTDTRRRIDIAQLILLHFTLMSYISPFLPLFSSTKIHESAD